MCRFFIYDYVTLSNSHECLYTVQAGIGRGKRHTFKGRLHKSSLEQSKRVHGQLGVTKRGGHRVEVVQS